MSGVQKIDLGLKDAYDELFMDDAGRAENRKPKVAEILLENLAEFPNHPFKVNDDAEMEQVKDSISKNGVLTPAIARERSDGKFEIISGHRRLAACRSLGLAAMPVIVRNMTDDEAVITMVDTNLQREHILPSEKAFAYKMKLEAMSRQGKRSDLTSGQVGQKWSRDEVADKESGRQVQRYIRLTNLIPELLDKVDEGKMAMSPAVEISYLSTEEQRTLLTAMEQADCTPSHAQAIELKKLSQEGALFVEDMIEMLMEPKANQREMLRLPMEQIRKYVPDSDPKRVQDFIMKACEHYRKYLNRQKEQKR